MKFLQLWKPVLVALITVFIVFAAAGIFDIILAVLHPRFYSNAAFCVIFGVAGIFASIFAFSYGKAAATEQNKTTRWVLTVTIIIAALVFFFVLAPIENDEYEWACRSFAITLAAASLFFAKEKILE